MTKPLFRTIYVKDKAAANRVIEALEDLLRYDDDVDIDMDWEPVDDDSADMFTHTEEADGSQ